MTWNTVTKVFNIECPLEPACKEAAERGDKGGKGGHDQGVDLEGRIGD